MVVEFNDIAALEQALQPEDVACVLAEPALTNVGIVLPDPTFHQNLRELTQRYGTLLIIDETHTICTGPGGYTRAENLAPDFVVFGKPIGGGVPGATYGFTEEVAHAIALRQILRTVMLAAWAELLLATHCRLLPCAPLWKRFLRKARSIR
jgi:glutamate-1-semialdehyde 2,1-aminomutase